MIRTLTCSVLIVLSIFLFWCSFSGMNAPSSARGGPAASLASGSSSPPSKAPRAASPARVSAGGRGGRATIAPNSPMATSAANQFTCKTQCQASDTSCEGVCYQQYNVTNQTQYWSQCMQSCGTKLSVCSNGCTAGLSTSSCRRRRKRYRLRLNLSRRHPCRPSSKTSHRPHRCFRLPPPSPLRLRPHPHLRH